MAGQNIKIARWVMKFSASKRGQPAGRAVHRAGGPVARQPLVEQLHLRQPVDRL